MYKLGGTRWLSVVLAIGGVALSQPTAASGQVTGKQRIAVERLAAAYDGKDCSAVLEQSVPFIAGGKPAGIPGDLEMALNEMALSCELREGAQDKAYAHALRLTELENSSDWVWHLRFGLEVDSKRYDAAVKTVEAMTQ